MRSCYDELGLSYPLFVEVILLMCIKVGLCMICKGWEVVSYLSCARECLLTQYILWLTLNALVHVRRHFIACQKPHQRVRRDRRAFEIWIMRHVHEELRQEQRMSRHEVWTTLSWQYFICLKLSEKNTAHARCGKGVIVLQMGRRFKSDRSKARESILCTALCRSRTA